MKKLMIGILAFIGAMALLAALVVGFFGLVFSLGEEGVPDVTIVELDLENGLVEYIPDDPIGAAMLSGAVSVRDVVDGLKRAAEDDRVVGLVAKVGNGRFGMAQIQEIRDAVETFQESGKPAVAWAETFGEVGPGNGSYYLATAFDRIYLQPTGDIGLTGLVYESPFIAGALDKLKVEAHMDQRYEYKNAMNMYTETGYTEPHRRAMQALMDSQFAQMVDGIAESRGMEAEEVRGLFDQGSFLGEEAMEARLVDGLAYRDEVFALVQEEIGQEPDYLYLPVYLERAGRSDARGKTIGLVYAVGVVVRGDSEYEPLSGSYIMGSDSVSAALRSAIDDPKVEAIVMRVDSPGGSYVASDTIWRETVRAREAGKPLVISMGNLAASGGYFVSMSADKIVAQPGTITGSIGVLGGKMNTSAFWERLGITFDEVHTSANSLLYSSSRGYSESEYALFQGWLDRVYTDFTQRVSQGRGMPIEGVREIAKGRVWSGQDALELGLVDELGGLDRALELAREAAGISADEPVRVKLFPKKKTLLEALLDQGPSSSHEQVFQALGSVLVKVRPVFRAAETLGILDDRTGTLSMPPVEPVR